MHATFDPSCSSSPEPFISSIAQPSDSLSALTNKNLSSSSPLDPLYTASPELPSKNSYRLVGSASGTDRSSGSLLEDAATALAYKPRVDLRDPESLKEYARRYRERTARALALEEAALEYQAAVHQAGIVRRRIERRQAAQRRRAEREGLKENRRPNRPVHVDVDPAAWDVVKRKAFRHRRTVGDAVGELVSRSVQDRFVPRYRPTQRSVQRFARLFVDEETWAQFRVLAFDLHVSIGRFVGLLVEREARRLGDGGNQ